MELLLSIGVVLIIMWLVGFVAFPVISWFIHILLVLAIIMILLRVIRGK